MILNDDLIVVFPSLFSFTTPESEGPVSRIRDWAEEVENDEMRTNVRRDMEQSVSFFVLLLRQLKQSLAHFINRFIFKLLKKINWFSYRRRILTGDFAERERKTSSGRFVLYSCSFYYSVIVLVQ